MRILQYIILFFLSLSLFSQEPDKKENSENTGSTKKSESNEDKNSLFQKGQINVIGDGRINLKKIPGSATIIGKKFLDETQPVDTMEVLRRVPGASVRYQDSAGLTPNIGFRGVSNEESRKTLILEDGVLTSLSPYGQPESYYMPQIDRMQRVEIVKGSGSILFGPSTIGGVINFVTRTPPVKPTFSIRSTGGMNNYFANSINYGGTSGKTGVDVSFSNKQGDGFRDFNFFNVNEFYLKLVHQINEKHTVSLKLGYHDQKAQSTYLGLTQGLFWKDPHINPAQFDKKIVARSSAVISHEYNFSDNIKIITKTYTNRAVRNWAREEFSYNNINQNGVPAPPPSDVFNIFAPNPILNRAGDVLYMRRGYIHRDQGFLTIGAETKAEIVLKTGEIKHEIDLGIRAHYENNNVSQNSSIYPGQKWGYQTNYQERGAKAYAVYIQDRISITDRLKIMPGMRYENITQGVYTKRRSATAQDVQFRIAGNVGDVLLTNTGNETYTKILLPGFGVTYDITTNFNWFAGVHKGFSPPTYGTAISPNGTDYRLKAEISTNYETGVRGDITNYLFMESALYILYFTNQIINTSEIGGESGSRPVNSGKSIHRGSENTVTFDWGRFFNSNWRIPLDFIYSYTNAKSLTFTPFPYTTNSNGTITLLNTPPVTSDSKGYLIKSDTNGNYLPYVPQNVITIALGFSNPEGYYARTEYQYIGKQFSDLSNTRAESFDGTTGIIPAYGLWNASLGFKHPVKKWSIFLTGKNLQDREYVSGRLPIGIQPGPFRQINFGFSLEF